MIRVFLALILACFGLSADAQMVPFPPLFRVFTPLHLYYIAASGCNDANAGTSPGSPWCTPNHSVVCGDVIIAAAGDYSTTINSAFPFGTVSSCPSVSGGIDGTGGIYFATVLCGGTDVTACHATFTSTGYAIDVAASNWAVEGFQLTGNSGKGAFHVNGVSTRYHHIAFINDVAFNVGIGFVAEDDGVNHSVPGTIAYDYVAYIGNIAQNAEQNTVCTAAMVMVAPSFIDTNPGTHFLMYGNFSYNHPSNGCSSDEEAFMFDTFDAHGVTNQAVMLNNIGWSAYRFGMHNFVQSNNSVAGLHVYIENNTLVHNNVLNGGAFGDLNIQVNSNTGIAPTFLGIKNIGQTTVSTGCGWNVGGTDSTTIANITVGQTGSENILFASGGGTAECPNQGFVFGPNFQTDPLFANLTDLITNRSGAPSCGGFVTTTACMGWNTQTRALTTLSPIGDLQASCGNCAGKGYQKPSTTCVTSGPYNDLYPTWLKGIVYLHWNSAQSQVQQRFDLVTLPCGL